LPDDTKLRMASKPIKADQLMALIRELCSDPASARPMAGRMEVNT
jgi:hypothetical protein